MYLWLIVDCRSTSLTALPSSRRGDLRDGEHSRTVSLSKGQLTIDNLTFPSECRS